MQTKQSFGMKMTYWLKVVSLGLILGLGLQFAQAWTAPTVAPPGGNVAGPVTTGGNQVKTGSLTVSGGLSAPSFVDSDNVSYFLNPSSLSALYNATLSFFGSGSDDDQGLKIDVASANADTLLLLSSADGTIAGGSDFIRATDGATGVFVVEGDGDTGIGTTTPTQRLDVNGGVKANEFCIGTNCINSWPSGGGSGTVTSLSAGNGITLSPNPIVGVGTISWSHTATQALNMANFDINAAKNVNATAFYYTSDSRLKEGIETLDGSLDKLLRLDGVSFRWKQDGRQDIGVIAQDVEEVFPELVKTDPTTGFKSVEYGNLVAPLIEAVKEQQREIDSLEARIRLLEGK